MKSLAFLIAMLIANRSLVRADSAAQIRERKVDVGNGISLREIEAGQGGSTLVFVPGWSTGADAWRRQIDHFAPTHRVISFDPRSQGDSTKTTKGNTPEMRAVDLHNLLEKLGARRPVLIGWSQGVQDVAAYVEHYGSGDLAGIVLVDAAVSDGTDGMAARAEETAAQFKMFAVYQAHQPEYLRGMMEAIISKPPSETAMNQLIGIGMKTPPDIGVAMLVSDMFGVNRTAALKKISCPTLIIASAKSNELARQEAEISQIPHARLEKFEDAAHAVFIDQPERFDEVLDEFLKGLGPAPKTSTP